MDYRPFIERMLREASDIARAHAGKVTGWAKDGDNQDMLTQTDLAIGKLIVSAVEKEFPSHNVIDEEAGAVDKQSNLTWVIDPIDGTSNFASGSPLYGIMIGLLENERPIAGGFALPYFNEIYLAARGQGATMNGSLIHVTDEVDMTKTLVALGLHAKNGANAQELGRITGALIPLVRNLRAGASVFDSAMVARGTYGAYASSRGMIWDCVAPHIVIEEAGGVFTHFDGTAIDYSNATSATQKQFSYSMGSPAIHRQVLTQIS